MRSWRALIPVVAAVLVAARAEGATILYDFESEAATFISPPAVSRPGALTSLGLSSGGLTLTLSRQDGAGFDIVDNTAANQGGKPASFKTRSLDPFFAVNGSAFVGNFSLSVDSVSIDFGDYGQDSVDMLSILAYSGLNGTGSLIASSTTPYTVGSFPGIATGSVSGTGIRSIVFIGGTPDFTNSVFYDNITVGVTLPTNGVPEPSTVASLGLAGLIGLAARFRRRLLVLG